MDGWTVTQVSREDWEALVRRACAASGEALSRLVGMPVTVEDTAVEVLPVSDPGRPVDPGESDRNGVWVAWVGVEGRPHSALGVLFRRDEALALAGVLLGTVLQEPDEMTLSLLQEVANIMGTSFLNVLAPMMQGMRLLPTTPSVGDMEAFEMHLQQADASAILYVHMLFRFDGAAIGGSMVVVL